MKGTRRTHFKPTNIELLNILEGRIVRDKRCSFITDMRSLYEREPWLLQHVRHVSFKDNEWFYFVRRNKPPGMKKAGSKRPSRKVAESGIWKTSGVVTQIKNQDGVIVGSKKNISFKANSDTVKDGITTGWTMHEFVLDRPWFQEVVICRIRFHKRKENAQYAPRFLPIVIGRERGDSINHGAAAAGEELDAPVETHQDQCMEQWTGSCSREVVSYLASQQIMVQGSNYPILNGGMMQHQDFGSYGQQHNHIIEQMEQCGQGLGQETTDSRQVPMMMNQTFNKGQQWNGYSGSSSAHQKLGQDMVPMTQCLMGAQGQQLSVNGSMEQHQDFGSYGQQCGELLGQQQTMEEEQQQWNEYFGPYSAQPYDQGMMEHQDFSPLGLAQNHQSLGQNNDLSAFSELSAQQQHSGEDSNVSLTQQPNQIPGQVTLSSPMEQHLCPSQVPVMMNQALEEEHYVPGLAQPYDQCKAHNNELPMNTQQHDSVIINSAAQQHLEGQDNVPLINQTIEAQATDLPVNQGIDESHGGILGSPNYNEFLGEEEMESEMDNIRNDFLNEEWVQKLGKNTPEEEAELMADFTNCETFESFLDSLLSK